MQAAYYDRLGPAREVLQVAELPLPEPAAGEVRVRVRWSGVNPSDVKSRQGLRSPTMPFARVVPHSDGMGVIDAVGAGVPAQRIGQRVWTWNAAWGRPHGTACQFVCLPQQQAVPLPDGVPDEAGACLGIPALTALHAVLLDGGVAVHLAHRDLALLAVSRAPLAEIERFRQRMGWRFRWVSSHASSFNQDFGVSFSPEQLASGAVDYNYGRRPFPSQEAPGISVFCKDADGQVFHTYSTYGRGVEVMMHTYNLLDLTPKGRDEDALEFTMAWVRHHDRYEG